MTEHTDPAVKSRPEESARATNDIMERFTISELERELAWVNWSAVHERPLSAGAALSIVNDRDPHIRVDPTILGAQFAFGAKDLREAYPYSVSGDLGRHINEAVLLYAGKQPKELAPETDGRTFSSNLETLRQDFFSALARDWQKTKIFEPIPGLVQANPTPRYNGFTILNAAGKSFEDLGDDPSLMKVPGIQNLGDAARRALLCEWFDERGLDRHYTIGTIEFSLASIVINSARLRGKTIPDHLEDRTVLVKAFQDLVTEWKEDPQSFYNPVPTAAIHLARSSGEAFAVGDWQANIAGVMDYFAERWLANFGRPPAPFNRAEAALEILERMSGEDLDDLRDTPREFTTSHSFGLTQTVFMTPLDWFLSLADMPGIVGVTIGLKCNHATGHEAHRLNPRKALQQAEEAHNAELVTHPWIVARAKETLRLAREPLDPDRVEAEVAKLAKNLAAETEDHRHFVNGLNFLKDWYISQIPIVGGIYNIEEGIRHHQPKQIVGGALALGLEAGGLALGIGRGGMSLDRIERSPVAMAHETTSFMMDEVDIPLSEFRSTASGPAAAPIGDVPADFFEISIARADDVASDVPPRFAGLQPGVTRAYEHPVTGESLTVTRIGSSGEIVALKPVAGRQRTFQAVDWVNGEASGKMEREFYHLDPETGVIEKGGCLRGGGLCGSRMLEADMDDPYDAFATPQNIRAVFSGPGARSLEATDDIHGFSEWRRGSDNPEIDALIARMRGRPTPIAEEATESMTSGLPSPSDLSDIESIDLMSTTRRPSIQSDAEMSAASAELEGLDLDKTPMGSRADLNRTPPAGWGSADVTPTAGRSPASSLTSNTPLGRAQASIDPELLADFPENMDIAPFDDRIGKLADRARTVIVMKESADGSVQRTAFLDDAANLNQVPIGWYAEPGEVPSNEPILAGGPSLQTLGEEGQYLGDTFLGRRYLYKGNYWSKIFAESPEQAAYRAQISAEMWNASYESFGFGHAYAYDLGEGNFAISTPPVPVLEGYARGYNPPRGTYGPPPSTSSAARGEGLTAEIPRPPAPQPGDIGERLVVATGGHRVDENVYWYGDDYWTFQSGPTLAARYQNALGFARSWDEAYGAATGLRAEVRILPADRSVAVLTKPVASEAVKPSPELGLDEIGLADPHEVPGDVPARFADLPVGSSTTYKHPVTGDELTVARIPETDEVLALRPVPGEKDTLYQVDWINGAKVPGAELSPYHLDRETGQIHLGGKLPGGGANSSKSKYYGKQRGDTSESPLIEDREEAGDATQPSQEDPPGTADVHSGSGHAAGKTAPLSFSNPNFEDQLQASTASTPQLRSNGPIRDLFRPREDLADGQGHESRHFSLRAFLAHLKEMSRHRRSSALPEGEDENLLAIGMDQPEESAWIV